VKSDTLVLRAAPVPKARPRLNRKTGGIYTPRQSKLAEDLMATLMASQLKAYGPAEIGLRVNFAFSTRKSGDLDNCLKLVMDALQKARVIDNDRQIRKITVTCEDVKIGEEHTAIRIVASDRPDGGDASEV
jgi:Holliday junction resolvase RusA-like endonuclease